MGTTSIFLLILLTGFSVVIFSAINENMKKKKKDKEKKKIEELRKKEKSDREKQLIEERLLKIRNSLREKEREKERRAKEEHFKKMEEQRKEKLKKEKLKKERQDKDAPDLTFLYIKYINDWNNSSHQRKIKCCYTYREGDILVYRYNFLCGSILYLVGTDKIIYIDVNKEGNSLEEKTSVYKTIEPLVLKMFKDAINATINYINFSKQHEDLKSKWEQQGWRSSNSNSNNKNSNSNSNTNSNSNSNKKTNTNTNRGNEQDRSHPKWSVYETLLKTASSRREQMNKMTLKDPNRESMMNELKSVEERIKLFKQKYKFSC